MPRSILLLLLICLGACTQESPTFIPSQEAVEINNRGVGLMGYFDYEGARQTFAELSRQYPEWLEVKVNLAIATLNRQQEGDELTALTLVQEVLREDPDHLRAHYVAGLLNLNRGEMESALFEFGLVSEADPNDAYALYYTAFCQLQLDQLDQAQAGFEKALALDPYLRSAYYSLFQIYRQKGDRDQARHYLDQFTRLEKNPKARLAEFKYTRMGKRGNAQVVDVKEDPITPPEGPLFAEAEALGLSHENAGNLTVADINSDGLVDIFVVHPEGSQVWINLDNRSFQKVEQHALSVSGVNGALWGDIDNNGLPDVYLLRNGPNQLWQKTDSGWVDTTASTGVSGGDIASLDGQMFDADHDGDLDIFVINRNAPNELYNNNLDGSFRTLAKTQGLSGKDAESGQLVVADIDADRDADLLIVKQGQPNEIFINDRLWDYQNGSDESWGEFYKTALIAAVAGDIDADGDKEIYGVSDEGRVLVWSLSEEGVWQKQDLGIPPLQSQNAPQLALLDVSGNGVQELLLSRDGKVQIYGLPAGDLLAELKSDEGDIVFWSPLVTQPGLGPGLAGLASSGELLYWPPGSGRHPFLSLTFSGKEDEADSMRSNASGIGTQVHVRVGSTWSALTTYRQWSGPGQSLQPLAVGLSAADQLDYVAMTWSDGVFQTELDLRAGQQHAITETQRQLSSCPVLFAWDGQKWSFLTDVLGVGGLGFNVAAGEYTTPRPWERLLVNESQLQVNDGQLSIKVTEPMEELAYLDAMSLTAVDLPKDWHLVIDERMATGLPEVTGDYLYYQREILPNRVINQDGEDVTASVAVADLEAASVPPRDSRFIGRLSKEHVLTLEFDKPLPDGKKQLVADGWVEYPYSQTGFSAWQAGETFDPPTLEAKGADGVWRVIYTKFGYPAGMPRRMSVPLENLPERTQALRIRTNLQLYWDRITIAYPETDAPAEIQAAVLSSAMVAYSGFPKRKDGPQRQPSFDYQDRIPLWDTRYPDGFYTAFGEAKELLTETDNALLIIGPGEEVTVSFEAFPKVKSGWRRFYVLETRGWAKDMDLYTKTGGSVGPLPKNDSASNNKLNQLYNTRYQSGY